MRLNTIRCQKKLVLCDFFLELRLVWFDEDKYKVDIKMNEYAECSQTIKNIITGAVVVSDIQHNSRNYDNLKKNTLHINGRIRNCELHVQPEKP